MKTFMENKGYIFFSEFLFKRDAESRSFQACVRLSETDRQVGELAISLNVNLKR